MGLRGPKAKPTALKLLNGESRPSRINRDEPDLPAPSVRTVPKGLTGAGRAEWGRLIDTLIDRGVLTAGDMAAFEDYCRALSELRKVEAAAKRLGLELAIAKGVHGAAVKLRSQVAQLRAHLGLSPASRNGVKAASGQKQGAKLAMFIGGKSAHA